MAKRGRPAKAEDVEKEAKDIVKEGQKEAEAEPPKTDAPAEPIVMIEPLDRKPKSFDINGKRFQISGGISEHPQSLVTSMLATPHAKFLRVYTEAERKALKDKEISDAKAAKEAEEKRIKDAADFAKKAQIALAEHNAKASAQAKTDRIKALKLDIDTKKIMIKDIEAEIKGIEKELSDLEK